MREYETVKVYDAPVRRWFDGAEMRQVELPYKELDRNGRIVRTGTADFQPALFSRLSVFRKMWSDEYELSSGAENVVIDVRDASKLLDIVRRTHKGFTCKVERVFTDTLFGIRR